ncbi:hypothetical protein ACSBR1_013365 [Camellia fascicularis]
MERNSLSNNLKHHSIDGGRSIKEDCNNNNNNNRVKDSWESCKSDRHGEDFLNGFSWPPRSYTCSFCKREFKSAQALGGHMNVHRRDRARLRQSPPPRDGQYPFLNLNLSPNPNPSPNSNPYQNPNNPSTPFTSTLAPLFSPSISSLSSSASVSASEIMKWGTDNTLFHHRLSNRNTDFSKTLFGVEIEHFAQVSGCEVSKTAEIVRVDLEIGLLRDPKDDLDLELHLGCS